MSARQSLKRLVLARPSPLPHTKTWHRQDLDEWVQETMHYTAALGDSQRAEDPGGGSASGFLCPVSWSWALEWCCCSCCFASGNGPHPPLPRGAFPAVCSKQSQTISSTICLWDSSLHTMVSCLLTEAVTTFALLRITSGNWTFQNKKERKTNKILHSLPRNHTLISSPSPSSTCDSHLCCGPCHSRWGQSWLKKVPYSLRHLLLIPYLP